MVTKTAVMLSGLAVAVGMAQEECVEPPPDFLPMASDCTAQYRVVREASQRVPGATLDYVVADIPDALKRLTRSRECKEYRSDMWDTRWGNQMYIWAQHLSSNAICGEVAQGDPKIFGLDYCRKTLRGDALSKRCATWVRAREPEFPQCVWHAWGEFVRFS